MLVYDLLKKTAHSALGPSALQNHGLDCLSFSRGSPLNLFENKTKGFLRVPLNGQTSYSQSKTFPFTEIYFKCLIERDSAQDSTKNLGLPQFLESFFRISYRYCTKFWLLNQVLIGIPRRVSTYRPKKSSTLQTQKGTTLR